MTDPETEPEASTPIDGPEGVAFVVPAAAYDSIATDDELTRPETDSFPIQAVPYVDADPAPTLSVIDALGRKLGEKIDALGTRFDREVRAEASREKVVDRLHAELQGYKQDLLLNAMRPVFVDLIQLHDDVGKMEATLAEESPRASEVLRGVAQGIEDILYRQGIEPFQHDAEAFDAKRQRAIATVPTDDGTLARRVAERHRKGFASGDKVIRPEIVSVYVVRAAQV